MESTKWVVITTINHPNPRILDFMKYGYRILIVGDRKTPETWRDFNPKIEYFSYEDQEVSYPELSKLIGPNTYARKNLGYLQAIKNGAQIIWETDDDTFPLSNFGDPIDALNEPKLVFDEDEVWNPFSYFLPGEKIWPRGYPLNKIAGSFLDSARTGSFDIGQVDILQTLVNREPDVDAIYRLTVNCEPIDFPNRSGAVFLKNGISPGNTQSTIWLTPKSMKSIYFPVTVNNRFADILKMYLAQVNNGLLYAGFWTEQFRNPHNYLLDLENEIEMYLKLDELCDFVINRQTNSSLEELYGELSKLGICKEIELEIVKRFEIEINELFNS